jgi:hypothetical protein
LHLSKEVGCFREAIVLAQTRGVALFHSFLDYYDCFALFPKRRIHLRGKLNVD